MKSVTLKDGRALTLREAREDDAEKLLAYMNEVGGESDFLTYGKNGIPWTAEQEKRFLRGLTAGPSDLFLVGFVGDELACSANLSAPRNARIAHNAEMGITVRKKYWHLGAATAVLGELIGRAKSGTPLRAIRLGVYENNERAVRLYRKFGFEYAGCRRRYFHVGDRYYDEILMELFLDR